MASNSTSLRLGTLSPTRPRDVTITASLFATLDLISGGRMEIGIGRGDSSRRVMGKQPTTFSQLEQFVGIFRDLTAAREIVEEGHPVRIAWAERTPRVWIAGYGPQGTDCLRGGRGQTILTRRENIKLKTIELRRRLHHQSAATTSTQMDQILS